MIKPFVLYLLLGINAISLDDILISLDDIPRSSAEYKKSVRKEKEEIDAEDYKFDEWREQDLQNKKTEEAVKEEVTKEIISESNSNTSIVQFDNSYGHIGYTDREMIHAKESIQFTKTKHAADDAPFCQLNDWAKVSWTALDTSTGQEVENSKSWKQGNSRLFRVGHYEVSKCWDVAIMQMKAGEKATIQCNKEQDTERGTESVNNHQRTTLEGSTAVIPDSSNLDYNIEIISCGLQHQDNTNKPGIELRNNDCMYIVTGGLRKGDRKLALTAGTQTVKNKKGQVLHDAIVKDFDPADGNQKWWHGKDMALHSLHPWDDFVLAERDGKTMMIEHEESFETHHGKYVSNKFAYHSASKHWFNEITDNHIIIDVSDPFKQPKQPIFAKNPGSDKINAQWDILYCDEIGQENLDNQPPKIKLKNEAEN